MVQPNMSQKMSVLNSHCQAPTMPQAVIKAPSPFQSERGFTSSVQNESRSPAAPSVTALDLAPTTQGMSVRF